MHGQYNRNLVAALSSSAPPPPPAFGLVWHRDSLNELDVYKNFNIYFPNNNLCYVLDLLA